MVKQYKKGNRGVGTRRNKKGKKGIAASYITRSRALRKLQLSLKDFRRLCILKGIYPRVPKKKKQGPNKTYYHVKDILFLAHEPLMNKFRELKIFLRKRRKAIAKKQRSTVKHLDKHRRPKFILDHLVKERYPDFVAALRDMDDALCMIHLFAHLPSGSIRALTPKRTSRCQRLSKEFQNYIARSRLLRKAFVSVKGIYYEAKVQNETMRWMVPHTFTPNMTDDVDYKVLSTFLEFYECFMKFANYRLYNDGGLHYPPQIDATLDAEGRGLGVLRLETHAQAKYREETAAAGGAPKQLPKQIAQIEEVLKDVEQADESIEEPSNSSQSLVAELKQAHSEATKQDATEETEGGEKDDSAALVQILDSRDTSSSTDVRAKVFDGLSFLLNRETPQESLEFIILSSGGQVLWQQHSTTEEQESDTITHQVVDRNVAVAKQLNTREYVQPQWVFDSLNAGARLPTEPFQPGKAPPPHLSPFVDNAAEGYSPDHAKVMAAWAQGSSAVDGFVGSEDEDSDEESDSGAEETLHATEMQQEGTAPPKEDSSSDDEEMPPAPPTTAKLAGKKRKRKKTDDALAQRKAMMPNKDRRLYKAMQMGIQKKSTQVLKLEAKRRKLNENEDGDKT